MRNPTQWLRRDGRGTWTPLVPVVLAFLGGGLWVSAELADEVLEGETRAFDTRVLLALRAEGDPADPLGPGWVEELGRDFTALGDTGVLAFVTLAVVGYLMLTGRVRAAFFLAAAVLGGWALLHALKWGFDRPRPDLVPHATRTYTSGFPSGHAMMSAVCYPTLAALCASVAERTRVKVYVMALAVLVTLIVGVSRVYLGVHWPTDVLAGWLAGSLWALGVWRVMRRFEDKTLPKQESTT